MNYEANCVRLHFHPKKQEIVTILTYTEYTECTETRTTRKMLHAQNSLEVLYQKRDYHRMCTAINRLMTKPAWNKYARGRLSSSFDPHLSFLPHLISILHLHRNQD